MLQGIEQENNKYRVVEKWQHQNMLFRPEVLGRHRIPNQQKRQRHRALR